jgi:hypothetical protein
VPDDFDGSSLGQATARAGMDTRQWTSIGVVENSIGGTSPVDFSTGIPFVNVRLHPSDSSVRCRVAQASAGVGEGSWHAIQAGDEVIVVLPEGDERAGGIITGHLSNGVDTFPSVVAGLDVTQNNINVQRTIPNTILEFENGWMVVNDTTQAQLAMDSSGNWSMQSGEGDYFRIYSAGFNFTSASNAFTVNLGGGKMLIVADPGSGNILINNAGGLVMIGGAGAQPADHVATIEGVMNLIQGFFAAWGLTCAALPIVGTALAALCLPPALLAVAELAIPAAELAAPLSSGPLLLPIQGALATPRVPGGTSGIGAGGVLV